MKTLSAVMILIFSAMGSFSAIAAENGRTVIGNVEMPEVQSSAAFEQIKKKLGKWEGQLTQSLTGVVYDVSYEWKLVSGGSTIIETAIEDGVEMLTTYSDEEGEEDLTCEEGGAEEGKKPHENGEAARAKEGETQRVGGAAEGGELGEEAQKSGVAKVFKSLFIHLAY